MASSLACLQSMNVTSMMGFSAGAGFLSLAAEALLGSWWNRAARDVQIENHHEDQDNAWEDYNHHLRRLTTPVGTEYQVNIYTANAQTAPAVAALTGGGYVIAWSSDDQDGSNLGIYAQRHTWNGAVYVPEFRVNSVTSAEQSNAAVAGLTDGGFVVAWQSAGNQDSSGYGIYAQRYTSDCVLVGSNFRVNTYTTNHQIRPAVAGLKDGGFIIVWESDGQDYGIYAQRYYSSGAIYGTEFHVNTYLADYQSYPAVTGLEDGGYVVAWQSKWQDGSQFGIFAQRYTASSAPYGSEFQVNDNSVYDQRYASVVAKSDGGYIVTWQSGGQDGSHDGIYYKIYSSGNVGGTEFQANTYTYHEQGFPSVAVFANGGFVITWQSYGQDASNFGIYAQRFYPSGAKYETEFLVNSIVSDRQKFPVAAVLTTTQYLVIAYESYEHDGSGAGIFAKLYTSPGDFSFTEEPTPFPTIAPTRAPSAFPTKVPTRVPTTAPTRIPSAVPTKVPTTFPTTAPTRIPSAVPTKVPTTFPTNAPTRIPSAVPTLFPTSYPTPFPTFTPTHVPTQQPTSFPTVKPTARPTTSPTHTLLNLKSGDVFLVNDDTYARPRSHTAVAGLSGGSFVVTWNYFFSDSYDVYARVYDDKGGLRGEEFKVNSYSSSHQQNAAVASLTDGGFIVVHESNNQDGSGYGVYAQRFTASLSKSGGEFRVNTYTSQDQTEASVAGLPHGGYVVTWTSLDQDGSSDGIFAQRYDAMGHTSGSEFRVNSYTLNDQSFSVVAAIDNGGFVIVWQSAAQDGSGYGVFGKCYDDEGNGGSEFQVNTYSSGDQQSPAVASLGEVGFMVVWESDMQDGSGFGVYAQRFSVTCDKIDGEIHINSHSPNGDQRSPSIACLDDETIIVSWTDYNSGSLGSGIKSVQFPVARDWTVTNDITESSQFNQAYGAVATVKDGVVFVWEANRNYYNTDKDIYARRYISDDTKIVEPRDPTQPADMLIIICSAIGAFIGSALAAVVLWCFFIKPKKDKDDIPQAEATPVDDIQMVKVTIDSVERV